MKSVKAKKGNEREIWRIAVSIRLIVDEKRREVGRVKRDLLRRYIRRALGKERWRMDEGRNR